MPPLAETLSAGIALLEAVLVPRGFHYEPGPTGQGSGGHYAQGRFVKGDRSIEFSLRHSLGLVSYVIGAISLPHERYFHTLAEGRGLHYPGFSDDPIDGFRHLARDLEEFGSDFTNGDASIFRNLARELDPPGRLP